jgi:hypothetical protein
LYLLNLVVLLFCWFFNLVASTCSDVVVVLRVSVRDVDYGRGVKKKKGWLVVLHLVEVARAILMWYAAWIIPGVGCIVELVA